MRTRLFDLCTVSAVLEPTVRQSIGTSSGQLAPGRECRLGPGEWLDVAGVRYAIVAADPRKVEVLKTSSSPGQLVRDRAWLAVLTLRDGSERVLNGKPLRLYGAMFRKAEDGRQVVVKRDGQRIVSRGQVVTRPIVRFGDGSEIYVAGQPVTIMFRRD